MTISGAPLVCQSFMDSFLTSAVFLVVIGSLLTFLTGILIGSSYNNKGWGIYSYGRILPNSG